MATSENGAQAKINEMERSGANVSALLMNLSPNRFFTLSVNVLQEWRCWKRCSRARERTF